MIVWAGWGSNSQLISGGGRYRPSTSTWSGLVENGTAPAKRAEHSAAWTGSEMIVWGGIADGGGFQVGDGGRYDPSSSTWSTLVQNGTPPSDRRGHTAVWTGSEMIVWGGQPMPSTNVGEGGRYNPSTNTWSTLVQNGTPPSARYGHSAVWTGSEVIVWGGFNGTSRLGDGARYNPSTSTWTPLVQNGTPPAPRYLHSAVWTGSEMIIWGGDDGVQTLKSGYRYDPSTSTWEPLDSIGAEPAARWGHTAVWTGSSMIVWGGFGGSNYLSHGGQWTP